MGKAGRWLRNFLAGGKKDGKRDRPHAEATPGPGPGATPKEKRWSFRRPVVLTPEQPGRSVVPREAADGVGASRSSATSEARFDEKKHAVAVAVAAATAADVAEAAAQAAATVARLSSRKAAPPLPPPGSLLAEAAAAVRIQASFRGYLARAALCALRGIVKLQALVRGQLVRKQAKATLRCMQALLAAQSQLRAQRMRFLQVQDHQPHHTPPPRPRPSSQHSRRRRPSYEMDRSSEENVKIVEMDSGVATGSDRQYSSVDYHPHGGRCSPAPSAMTELSPRANSWHVEDHLSFGTAHSSPHSHSHSHNAPAAMTEPAASDLPFPSYMSNTESSRAKARSQSAPRQRAAAEGLERQPSRRKGAEHRSVPRGARMQRSSSQQQAGSAPRQSPFFHRPWSSSTSVRLDTSLKDSECGSTTSSVLTAATTVSTVYSRTRSLVGFEVRRALY